MLRLDIRVFKNEAVCVCVCVCVWDGCLACPVQILTLRILKMQHPHYLDTLMVKKQVYLCRLTVDVQVRVFVSVAAN